MTNLTDVATNKVAFTLTSRPCPVCGSKDDSRIFADAQFDMNRADQFAFSSRKLPEYMHFRLVSCPDCDLLYASPIPSVGELATAYEEAAFDTSDEGRHASHTYGRLLPQIIRKLPSQSGALDIGTGDGSFLEVLQDYHFTDVKGVEPSQAPITHAKPHIRSLIAKGLFNPADFPKGAFSLVTCFQTMEHVYDPKILAQGVLPLLRPGGAFFFIAHNYRSVSAKILGTKSPIFDIEHMQLFSRKSGERLLTECGYSNVHSQILINRYPLHYWLKLLPIPTALKLRVLEWLKRSAIGRIPISIPAGNIAVIGYK